MFMDPLVDPTMSNNTANEVMVKAASFIKIVNWIIEKSEHEYLQITKESSKKISICVTFDTFGDDSDGIIIQVTFPTDMDVKGSDGFLAWLEHNWSKDLNSNLIYAEKGCLFHFCLPGEDDLTEVEFVLDDDGNWSSLGEK